MAKALITLDFEHIKGYVFGTGKLKEIRGASAILDEFNRIRMEEIVSDMCKQEGYEKIYAGGGGGMFIIPELLADKIIDRISKEFGETTRSATIVGEWVKVEDPIDSIRFKEHQSELIYRLHEKKFNQSPSESPLMDSFVKVCESCGKYPAQHHVLIKDKESVIEDTFICSSCKKKRDKNRKIKENLKQGSSPSDTLWKKIRESLLEMDNFGTDWEPVEDFREIGQMCKSRKGYMGLIYCDGNNMGRYIEKNIDSPKKLKEFSCKVEESLLESVMEAVDKHLEPHQRKEKDKITNLLPFDILLLGGDDLVMVTPADKIGDMAVSIGESFQQAMEDTGITLSIGLVIAKDSFPFNQFLAIAEDLLKTAKKGLAERELKGQAVTGMINFKTITASGGMKFNIEDYTSKFEEFNKNKSNKNNDNSKETGTLIRTLRPYSLEEMKKLLDLIKDFRKNGVPRSPVNFLRTVIDQSDVRKTHSFIETISLLARTKNKEHRKLFTKLIDLFNNLTSTPLPPWIPDAQDGSKFRTPIIDFTDLYPFIEKK